MNRAKESTQSTKAKIYTVIEKKERIYRALSREDAFFQKNEETEKERKNENRKI